jgi:hypothetical protein
MPHPTAAMLLDKFYVNNLAKLKIDTPDKDLTNSWVVDRMLSAHELYRKICYLKAWQPLDENSFFHRLRYLSAL